MARPHTKFLLLLLGVLLTVAVIVYREGSRTRNIVIKTNTLPLLAYQAVDIPITQADPVAGSPGAPLTLVEFIDLGNKQSLAVHKILYDFTLAHLKNVRLVWKDLPTPRIFGGDASIAHVGVWCAGEQGKFWQFLDATSTRNQELTHTDMLNTVTALGLDGPRWRACLEAGGPNTIISSNITLAKNLGFNKGPALFINNKQLDLTQEVNLKDLLESLVKP